MATPSRKIVVDTSIAHAAGSEDAVHPTPVHCRDFLKAMLECRHLLVMTPEIAQEWQQHWSSFTRKWRVAMEGRKLVYRLNSTSDPEFRKKVAACCIDEGVMTAVLKDIMLVEAALKTDRSISSLDDKMRGHLAALCLTVKQLAGLAWINPGQDGAVEWLRSGAPSHPHLLLKNHRKTTSAELEP